MRYQQPIFECSPDRNTDLYNVNMSSDICIYSEPSYTVSGGCKIITGMTTGNSCVHIFEEYSDNMGLEFSFSGGSTATTFSIEIHKYDHAISAFSDTVLYQENDIPYSVSHDTTIVLASLLPDGEYLIKLFYRDVVCTDILGRLGLEIDTREYCYGELYGLYIPSVDYYFIAFKDATVPRLVSTTTSGGTMSNLHSQSIIPGYDGQTELFYNNYYNSKIIVTLNGLTLSPNNDYSVSGSLITFFNGLKPTDMVTVAGVRSYPPSGSLIQGLTNDSFEISGITSGITGGQGNNQVYFNTDTSEYELFTTTNYVGVSLLSINGITIAPSIDYVTEVNSNRIVLPYGILEIPDAITINYQSVAQVIGNITIANPTVRFGLDESARTTLGWFEFQVSENTSFTGSATTITTIPYVVNQIYYEGVIDTTGYAVGDILYYRVINHKVYQTILGEYLTRTKMTDTIPITIMS